MQIRLYRSSCAEIRDARSSQDILDKFSSIPTETYNLRFENNFGNIDNLFHLARVLVREDMLHENDVIQILRCDPMKDYLKPEEIFIFTECGWVGLSEKDLDATRRSVFFTMDADYFAPEQCLAFARAIGTGKPISVAVQYPGSNDLFVRSRVQVDDSTWKWDGGADWDEPIRWTISGGLVSVVPDNALWINTPAGILVAETKGVEDEYPGFYVSLVDRNGVLRPLCTTEYSATANSLQSLLFANLDSEDPTNTIFHQ